MLLDQASLREYEAAVEFYVPGLQPRDGR
jgi:hypothetical protein